MIDLQIVGVDEGGVDPSCVDLTEVSAEAVEVKVTERFQQKEAIPKKGDLSSEALLSKRLPKAILKGDG